MLVAKNLWRSFGRSRALQGLDLEVERGSAYGFIGPNGAGKSTTLRILATIDRPDTGRVWIDGRDAERHTAEVRRRIGFMPDPFQLYDELTVRDYIDFYARTYRLPAKERRGWVDRAIELARVRERAGDKCGGLSKGWRQRVLLAKTLVHDPGLLLLDEPASGLDPAARIEFREIIKVLRELGKTVVVSSHILTELADFCDSVGIVERGRMLVSGRIEDILERLDPRDKLIVELAGDPTTARSLLAAVAEVGEPVQGAAGVWTLTAVMHERTGPAARAALLAKLVAAGCPVASLVNRRENLEDLFLKVAGGKGVDADRLKGLLASPGASA